MLQMTSANISVKMQSILSKFCNVGYAHLFVPIISCYLYYFREYCDRLNHCLLKHEQILRFNNFSAISDIGTTLALNPYKPSVFLWYVGKQCRPNPDAAERGVWSESPLFAYRLLYQDLNKIEKKINTSTLKIEID